MRRSEAIDKLRSYLFENDHIGCIQANYLLDFLEKEIGMLPPTIKQECGPDCDHEFNLNEWEPE